MLKLLSYAGRGILLFILTASLLLPLHAPQSAPSPSVGTPSVQSSADPAGAVETPIATTTNEKSARPLSLGLSELSPWSMFLAADWVVKTIMVGLAVASVMTWTIFLGKFAELFLMRRRLAAALRALGDVRSLQEAFAALGSRKTVLKSYLTAAVNEGRMSLDISNDQGVKERAASRFAEITRSETRRIRFGMGLLATIASTSPFVGLFGTVWGIMNSFIGISKAQTTNLAVVAPGIAEALLATAIGLFAAIPAVIIYNHFSRATRTYLELVNRAAGASGRLLSRDLDRGADLAPMSRAAE